MAGVERIELPSNVLETPMLPLYHTPINLNAYIIYHIFWFFSTFINKKIIYLLYYFAKITLSITFVISVHSSFVVGSPMNGFGKSGLYTAA